MTKNKIIKLKAPENEFKMLFKLNNDDLGPICYNIFKLGYDMYFPTICNDNNNTNTNTNTEINIIKNINSRSDAIKSDLQRVEDKLNSYNMEDKIDKFSDVFEELFGISNSSVKKGFVTENIIYLMLKEKFKDYSILETRSTPHSGDAIMNVILDNNNNNNNNNKIVKTLIEIKNYTNTVDRSEIDKLKYDMKHTGIKYSIFISIKSGFVGKKQMSIEEFSYNNNTYTIIYIPNLMGEISKVEAGVLMLKRLIEYNIIKDHKNKNNNNLMWLETNVTDHLHELDSIYSGFTKLRSKFYKMEKTINYNINDYYLEMRRYEISLKNKVNNIWKSVNDDFGNAKKELLASEKMENIIGNLNKNKTIGNIMLVKVFNIMNKHGFYVCATESKLLYHIMNEIDKDVVVGTLIKNPKDIQVLLDNPNIKLTIENSKSIIVLGNILSTY
jgi:hypothetical protein